MCLLSFNNLLKQQKITTYCSGVNHHLLLLFFSIIGEFYKQGDREKGMGLVPLSMMDREKSHMIPEDQVQFLTVVVRPCTELLKLLLPNTEDLYTECRYACFYIVINIDIRKCRIFTILKTQCATSDTLTAVYKVRSSNVLKRYFTDTKQFCQK